MRHLRRRHDIVDLQLRMALKLKAPDALTRKLPARRLVPPVVIDLLDLLHDLKEPRPAGNAVFLQ